MAYNGHVPINGKKLADLRKIVHYIPDEHRDFFTEILAWPTTQDREQSDEENA